MFTIEAYTVEFIKDPFGILSGKRYEFMLEIEVPEEDELFSENGLILRVVYSVDDERSGIKSYEFIEKETNKHLDFEMEAEEEKFVEAFCRDHLSEAEE